MYKIHAKRDPGLGVGYIVKKPKQERHYLPDAGCDMSLSASGFAAKFCTEFLAPHLHFVKISCAKNCGEPSMLEMKTTRRPPGSKRYERLVQSSESQPTPKPTGDLPPHPTCPRLVGSDTTPQRHAKSLRVAFMSPARNGGRVHCFVLLSPPPQAGAFLVVPLSTPQTKSALKKRHTQMAAHLQKETKGNRAPPVSYS